jgi:aminopeptidase N
VRVAANTPDEINEVFDGIAYEKAAAVIRMVEGYVGRERFRDAIRAYVRRYAFDNAAAEDLWNELTRVTGAPLDTIMASYIDQPGVPVLQIETTCVAGATEVTMTQERFAGAPGAAPGPESWAIPVCFTDPAGGAPQCEILTDARQIVTVPGCADTLFANANAAGYYLTQYSPAAVEALGRAAASALSPVERIGLLGDEWWMLQSGRHDAGTFLDLAGALAGDDTPAITATLAQRLGYTAGVLVPAGRGAAFSTWVRERFGPELEAMGLPGDPTDTDALMARRATLLGLVGGIGNDSAAQARARELALAYIDDPDTLPGTLVPTVLGIAAAGGDAALYDRYLAQLDRLSANPEEFYRYFNALASFADPALVARTLEFAISSDVRSQDSATLIGGLLASAGSREQAWRFTQDRWDALTAKVGDTFGGIQSIVGSVGSFCSADAAAEVTRFFDAHPTPAAERTLDRAIERIETCAAIQTRQRPAVAAWLDALP